MADQTLRAAERAYAADPSPETEAALISARQRAGLLTAERLEELGGNRWQRGTHDRVYINDLARWWGLELEFYNTGNICGAKLDGEKISNSRARKVLARLSGKLWWDVTAREWAWRDLSDETAQELIESIEEAAHG